MDEAVAKYTKLIADLDAQIEEARPQYQRAARDAGNVRKAAMAFSRAKDAHDKEKAKHDESAARLKANAEALAKARDARDEAKRNMPANESDEHTPRGQADSFGDPGDAGPRLTQDALAVMVKLMETGGHQALAKFSRAFKLAKGKRSKAEAAADMPPTISSRTSKRDSEAASGVGGTAILALEDGSQSQASNGAEPARGSVKELVRKTARLAEAAGSSCGIEDSMRR